jgi:gamma-D-glutamyl-L-lysine dipeptidyl-peptidase
MTKADETLEGAQIRVVPRAAQGAFSSVWLRYHVRPRFAPAFIVFLFALAVWVAVGRGNTPVPADDWVVVVPVANMYSSASEQTDVVSQAVLGNHVVVLETRGEWANVRTPDQYTGWMRRSELRKVNGAGAATRVVQVESLFANLYQEADVTMHRPVLTVPFESRLEVVGEGKGDDAGWLKVRLPDGRDAWIQSSDVITEPKPLTIEESIALAKRFLGLPYLWGGRSSYGYDCSGFTQMLVRSRGINMPRDADLQAAWEGMEVIDRKALRPGDLLFFGAGPDKITHTAMYIGGGEIVHATTHEHPVVQISQLDDQPWTRILVACRRIK